MVKSKNLPERGKVKRTYTVLPKDENNSLHTLQVIIYSDGSCDVGVDVWRNLDKKDMASHEIEHFNSESALLNSYHKCSNKHKKYYRKKGGRIYALPQYHSR